MQINKKEAEKRQRNWKRKWKVNNIYSVMSFLQGKMSHIANIYFSICQNSVGHKFPRYRGTILFSEYKEIL